MCPAQAYGLAAPSNVLLCFNTARDSGEYLITLYEKGTFPNILCETAPQLRIYGGRSQTTRKIDRTAKFGSVVPRADAMRQHQMVVAPEMLSKTCNLQPFLPFPSTFERHPGCLCWCID